MKPSNCNQCEAASRLSRLLRAFLLVLSNGCAAMATRDGSVRLVGGAASYQGGLEIYHQGAWGTVCAVGFGMLEANTICKQLGFPAGATGARETSLPRSEKRKTWLSGLKCHDNHKNISQCSHRGWGAPGCPSDSLTWLICNLVGTKGAVRLQEGSHDNEGRLEVYVDDGWKPVCERQFNKQVADVACRQLLFPRSAYWDVRLFPSKNSRQDVPLAQLDCAGTETGVMDCNIPPATADCVGRRLEVSLICQDPLGPPEGTLRLRGGPQPNEGRLEIYYKSHWGTICDSDWTQRSDSSARVACTQLGLGPPLDVLTDAYGPGNGKIWLSRVRCSGTEARLTDCPHNIDENDCDHQNDVGLICTVPCGADKIRLQKAATSVGSQPQLEYNGKWADICLSDVHQAKVFCKSLGLDSGTATLVHSPSWINAYDIKTLGTTAKCTGQEKCLRHCKGHTWRQHNRSALPCNHIICQSASRNDPSAAFDSVGQQASKPPLILNIPTTYAKESSTTTGPQHSGVGNGAVVPIPVKSTLSHSGQGLQASPTPQTSTLHIPTVKPSTAKTKSTPFSTTKQNIQTSSSVAKWPTNTSTAEVTTSQTTAAINKDTDDQAAVSNSRHTVPMAATTTPSTQPISDASRLSSTNHTLDATDTVAMATGGNESTTSRWITTITSDIVRPTTNSRQIRTLPAGSDVISDVDKTTSLSPKMTLTTNSQFNMTLNITTTAKDANDCPGFTLVGSKLQGYLLSPNFPRPYPNNVHCQWLLQVTSPHHIQLRILEFNTQKQDRLWIYRDSSERELLRIFEGNVRQVQNTSLTLTLNSSELLLVFASDSSRTDRGFHIEYSAILQNADQSVHYYLTITWPVVLVIAICGLILLVLLVVFVFHRLKKQKLEEAIRQRLYNNPAYEPAPNYRALGYNTCFPERHRRVGVDNNAYQKDDASREHLDSQSRLLFCTEQQRAHDNQPAREQIQGVLDLDLTRLANMFTGRPDTWAGRKQFHASSNNAFTASADQNGATSYTQASALVPPAFVCPISRKIMEEPVTAADGITYELSALRDWLAECDLSPVTNQQLHDKSMLINQPLKRRITEWKKLIENDVTPKVRLELSRCDVDSLKHVKV